LPPISYHFISHTEAIWRLPSRFEYAFDTPLKQRSRHDCDARHMAECRA